MLIVLLFYLWTCLFVLPNFVNNCLQVNLLNMCIYTKVSQRTPFQDMYFGLAELMFSPCSLCWISCCTFNFSDEIRNTRKQKLIFIHNHLIKFQLTSNTYQSVYSISQNLNNQQKLTTKLHQ